MSIFNIFILVVLILLAPTAYAGLIGAPYVPTFTPAIRRSLKKINLGSADLLLDLGSGDGKVLLEANKHGARAIGYELSPIMWFVTLMRLIGKPGTKVYWRNFYRQKLPQETTVIFLFLMPDKMNRIYEFLRQQNLPNLRYVVAYSFPFSNLEPEHSFKEPNCGTIFIYQGNQFHLAASKSDG